MREPATKLLSTLAMSLLLAGCATLEPALPQAQPQIAPRWPLPDATGNTPLALTEEDGATAVADIGWRDFFVDDRLDALIERALANNRDLRVAILNVERARARYRVQRADRLPSVGGGLDLSRGRSINGSSEVYQASVGITEFELDLFGRVRSLSAAALQQYLATEETRRNAQLLLIAEVATTWLALAADQESQRIAQATLDSYEAGFKLIEQRHKLGDVSALDVSQQRTLVEGSRADAARFAGQVLRDRNALVLLVGGDLDPAWLPDAFEPQISGLKPLPAGLPSEVLLRRPDIRAAEAQLRAANANIGAARAAFFPSIRLTGAVGVASDSLSNLFDSGSDTWSFIPSINIPIFQGGRLRAQRDVAVADRDIALAQYEQAIQAGFRDVADALGLDRTLTEQRLAQDALLDAAEQTHRLSEARYNAGQDSFLTLLDAQRTLLSARLALVAVQQAEQANRVQLYKALGGGWLERTP